MDNMSQKKDFYNKILKTKWIGQNVRNQSKITIKAEFHSHSAPSFKRKEQAFRKITGITWPRYKNLHKSITFEEIQHNNNHLIIQSPLTVSSFRAMLKKYYLSENKLPTIDELNDSSDNSDGQINRRDTSKAFVLKMLPGLTKGIIIEDPEIVYKRILYLKKIQQIRKDNKHIVYVRKTKCDSVSIRSYKMDNQTDIFMCVSTQIGLLKVFFCRPEDFENAWILDSISAISGPCAILVEEQDFEIPTQSSPKADMSHWLTTNGVLHDPTAHRGDLYELIRKTVVNGQMRNSQIDEYLIAEGHQVVRYPKCLEEIDFFDRLFCEMYRSLCNPNNESSSKGYQLDSMMKKTNVFDMVKSLTLSDWQKYETALIEKENLMYRDDMMMEKFVDNLCMMAADGKLPDDMKASLIDAVDWKKITSCFIVE